MALFNRRRRFRPAVRRWLPSLAGPTIALTDVVDYSGVQRAGGVGTLTISGTHTGATSVQARVVLHGTSTEVVTWTTIDASPGATTFSGPLASIPAGGWYNVQVRPGNATSVTANGSSRFGVGAFIGVIGQSKPVRYFTQGTDVTPDGRLAEYSGSAGTAWALRGATGNGANAFGNRMRSAIGGTVPVFLLNYAVGATALNSAGGGSGYWMNTAGGSPYALFLAGVNSVGGKLEAVYWAQGEQDGFSTAVSEAQYQSDLETFIARIRTDLGQASLPFIVSPLGRYTNAGPTDASWQGIKNAQITVGQQANNALAAPNDDLALVDGVHHTNAADITHGTRGAIATAFALGLSAYERGPKFVSATQTSSTVVVVTLTHDGGTDFTPSTGITGWDIVDNGTPATLSSVVRTSAASITLTAASALTGPLYIRHLYGVNPAVSAPLLDNTADALPADSLGRGALIYSVSVAENVALSDVAGGTRASTSSVAESATLADAAASSAATTSTVSESVALADAQTTGPTVSGAVSESLSLTDAFSASAVAAAAAVEALVLADAAIAAAQRSASVAESVALADQQSVPSVTAAAVAEALALVDATAATIPGTVSGEPNTTFVVPADDRRMVVPADDRRFVVP